MGLLLPRRDRIQLPKVSDMSLSSAVEEHDALVHALESGARVSTRAQFFTWTQGLYQQLVPHEILICSLTHPHTRAFQHHFFSSSRYFKSSHVEAIWGKGGIMRAALETWHRHERPVLAAPELAAAPHGEVLSERWQPALMECELKNLLAHGLRSMDGGARGFVAYARLPGGPQASHARAAQILAPFLVDALIRVLARENRGKGLEKPLSEREREIILWVQEGKTNEEIAMLLSVSPYTVKNHLQNIYAKLQVSTRGQAVAKAIGLGQLHPLGAPRP